MLSAKRAQGFCPQCRVQLLQTFRSLSGVTATRNRLPRRSQQLLATASSKSANSTFRPQQLRKFSSTRQCLQYARPKDEETELDPPEDIQAKESQSTADDVETVVRQARKTFGDTLPKDFLSEEEYNLYERLYGPPIRTTKPDDVGIPFPDTTGNDLEGDQDHHTLLRETEDGTLEEVEYTLDPTVAPDQGQEGSEEVGVDPVLLATDSQMEYIQAVANNQREYDALVTLQQDFEASALRSLREAEAQEEEEPEEEQDEDDDDYQEDEDEFPPDLVFESSGAPRLHPLSVTGQFATKPRTVLLPSETFVEPISELLGRTHIKHIKAAAEARFGGEMLPHSPATPVGKKNVKQIGVSMQAWHTNVKPIDADAYLAAVMPGTYATAKGCLTEVRKRLGPSWIQGLLAKNDGAGPRVLDVGGAGAALSAWNDLVQAEWDSMKEAGTAHGELPAKKSDKVVVVGSDTLRHRVKTFHENTTFIPRVPDYLHSAENVERLMDAPAELQPRKFYDVIICSHMLSFLEKPHKRRETIDNLWAQLNPDGGVLLIFEKGHPRGFEAVADARQRLLDRVIPPTSEVSSLDEIRTDDEDRPREPGMIVAPCTSHGKCPMYLTPGLSPGRKDFCHFNQRFTRPTFLRNIVGKGHTNHEDIQFSYVAMRRGSPSNASERENLSQGAKAADQAFKGYEAAETLPNSLSLPRVILPPLKRHQHVVIDMCTPAGKIERWTVSKAFSKQAYHDARKMRWGDLWGLGAKTRVPRAIRLGRGVESGLEALADGGVRAQKAAGSGKRSRPNIIEITQEADGRVGARDRNRSKFPERRTKGGRLPKRKEDLMKEIQSQMDDVSDELQQDYKDEDRRQARRETRGG